MRPVIPTFKRVILMAILALGLFWIVLIYQLSANWALYPQYSYGWAVPFLSAYFFWKRWDKCPPPGIPVTGIWPRCLMILLAAGFFAARFVQEANLIWRLPLWLMGFEVAAMTLLAIFLMGGRPWVKHFSFPVLFFLIAIPWLRPIEEPFILALTQFNTRVTVEIFSLFGLPVFQQGNVIET
nr:exosortase/archaeosortase family protein [Acidobacteriota bacterium]